MSLKIVKAEKKDLKEIADLVFKEFPYTNADEARIEKRAKRKNLYLFKGIEGKKLAGFVEFEIIEDYARINGLSVKEKFREKGYGEKLLEFAVEFLKKKKVRRIVLLVKAGNKAAKRLYEKFGFGFMDYYEKELDGSVVERLELDLEQEGEKAPGYVH